MLNCLKNALSESVLRVLSDINIFSDAVDEQVLFLIGELISGESGPLLPDLAAALSEGVCHHKPRLSGLHVVVHFF